MSFQRLNPFLLHPADMRILRFDGIERVDAEMADLNVLFGNVAVSRFKINFCSPL